MRTAGPRSLSLPTPTFRVGKVFFLHFNYKWYRTFPYLVFCEGEGFFLCFWIMLTPHAARKRYSCGTRNTMFVTSTFAASSLQPARHPLSSFSFRLELYGSKCYRCQEIYVLQLLALRFEDEKMKAIGKMSGVLWYC